MAVDFERALPPASTAAIEAVEARLEVAFPDDYQEFLRRQNGGKPEPNSYNRRVGVRYLYSAGPNDDEYVDDLEEAAMRSWADPMTDPPEDPMDRSLLPIGEDAGNNLICLRVSGDERGAVYFRDHEVPESPEAYMRLADSFGEFFEALRPEE